MVFMSCGPRVQDEDSAGEHADEQDAADDACGDGSCPPELLCGEEQRNCRGVLGIGDCIDGKCGPRLFECVGASSEEQTCAEVCGMLDMACVENGCDGATAFGYPGPQHEAVHACGSASPSFREWVTEIPGPCDQPLSFTGDDSFSIYKCCCDDPDW